MKRFHAVLLITFFLTLVQGCVWCRHWNLGACQELPNGIYGHTVKAPRFSAGVNVYLAVDTGPKHFPYNPNPNPPQFGASVKVRIQNKESHTIEIQGLNTGNVYLKPEESFELDITHNPTNEINEVPVCSLDTHSGAIKIEVDVLNGRPKGATVIIRGESCDGI
jgi:hypothetical protein